VVYEEGEVRHAPGNPKRRAAEMRVRPEPKSAVALMKLYERRVLCVTRRSASRPVRGWRRCHGREMVDQEQTARAFGFLSARAGMHSGATAVQRGWSFPLAWVAARVCTGGMTGRWSGRPPSTNALAAGAADAVLYKIADSPRTEECWVRLGRLNSGTLTIGCGLPMDWLDGVCQTGRAARSNDLVQI
jgi:hypothetical protein